MKKTSPGSVRRAFQPWNDPAARPLVSFQGVTKRFGDVTAVGDLSLALERAGITAADVAASKADPSRYAAYLELHIEQGPVLWRKKIAIGIPTAIVGITRYEVTITGEANHAGTTPMKERHDAMRTAARILDRWFVSIADRTDMVSTVGVFRLEPGVAPVVPGTAVFTLELRSTDDAITGKASIAAAKNATFTWTKNASNTCV